MTVSDLIDRLRAMPQHCEVKVVLGEVFVVPKDSAPVAVQVEGEQRTVDVKFKDGFVGIYA
jgi:hypothetical protein